MAGEAPTFLLRSFLEIELQLSFLLTTNKRYRSVLTNNEDIKLKLNSLSYHSIFIILSKQISDKKKKIIQQLNIFVSRFKKRPQIPAKIVKRNFYFKLKT